MSEFWDVRAGDLVRVVKVRGHDILTVTGVAGELIWEPGQVPYWTHTLGGVFFYEEEKDTFVEQEITILKRKGVRIYGG